MEVSRMNAGTHVQMYLTDICFACVQRYACEMYLYEVLRLTSVRVAVWSVLCTQCVL
jgi:hypothetical protein